MRRASSQRLTAGNPEFPDADALAARRAWYAGLSSHEAASRYLPRKAGEGRSARGMLSQARRVLIAAARLAHRDDLVALLGHPAGERVRHAKAVAQAIETLRHAQPPEPQIAEHAHCGQC